MTTNVRQYIPVNAIHPEQARNPKGCLSTTNFIELYISYDEGSRNWMTGEVSTRGYYLHASPIEHNAQSGMTGTLLGSGIKTCLLDVTRRSGKQLEIATKIAESKASALLEWCHTEYGIAYEVPDVIFPEAKKREVPKNMKKPDPSKKAESVPIKPIRTMKLLTAEVIRKLEKHPFGSQDSKGDNAQVLAKFFGGGTYTFLVTEAEKQENGDWLLYGKATFGYEWEWGYTLLSEIEQMKFPPFGLGAERDMYLATNATVSDLVV